MVAHYNNNKQTDGIICDLCGQAHTDKFIYFSGRFDCVEVDCSIQKSGPSSVDKRCLDVDVCEVCFEAMKKKMVDNINKQKTQGTWSTK